MAVVIYPLVVSGVCDDPYLDNGVIAWRDLFQGGAVTASSETSDGSVLNATDGTTNDYWVPSSMPAWTSVVYPSAQAADYLGIAAHTCGSRQITVICEALVDSAWIEIASVLPADDSPLMLLFNETYAASWRVRFEGQVVPAIGVMMLGMSLTLPLRIYGGHTPITLGKTVELMTNISLGGHLVGTTIRRTGAETEIALRHLPPAWVRSEFADFQEHFNTGRGFFYAWRPMTFPKEIGYCWRRGDEIRPVNMGVRDLMECNLSVKAHIG